MLEQFRQVPHQCTVPNHPAYTGPAGVEEGPQAHRTDGKFKAPANTAPGCSCTHLHATVLQPA